MYQQQYPMSLTQAQEFWRTQAKDISWFKTPETILSYQENGLYKWYPDGELNTCYLAIDKHVEDGFGDQVALIYDSAYNKEGIARFTYKMLQEQIAKLAGGLKKLGVNKGDTVIIYMPMVPQAAIAMLACARIGAIHSVVFGGFAPRELAIRIDDALPKVIISASCGIEFGKVIPYQPLLQEALNIAQHKPNHTIIYQREQLHINLSEPREQDFNTLINTSQPTPCVSMNANDPLYVLYTSGTTGKPKGIVRDNGGHAVAMKYSITNIYSAKPGSVFWAASDVGWVVGHSYIVYAPLISRCTTLFFEGKPIKTPDAGTFWRVIEQHKVNTFFTAPTAIRAIKKEDPDGVLYKKYDLSALQNIFLAGERCDPPTYEWVCALTQKPVFDHWWQTESGWPMLGIMTNIDKASPITGSAGKPVCGFDVTILNEDGTPTQVGEQGFVAVKLPLPPGCLLTLWKDEQGFIKNYLSTFKGYYLTGDGGYKNEQDYFFIMGRVDDVINVAGHRLSTGEMEQIVAQHFAIAECAVVGIADELKGQAPIGLVVIKDSFTNVTQAQISADTIQSIRDNIGAVACYKTTIIVSRLPKTRSGKILRRTIRDIADGKPYTIPSTIDDPAIIDEIIAQLKAHQIGIAFKKEV